MTCFGLSVCLDQYLACGAVSCLLALLATPKGCQFCVAFSYRAFLVEHRLVFFCVAPIGMTRLQMVRWSHAGTTNRC